MSALLPSFLALLLLLLLTVPTTPSSLKWTNLTATSTSTSSTTSSPLLHPTSYTLPAGETLGILGPSGAGKSTFLLSLANLAPNSIATTGTVTTGVSPCHLLQTADVAFLSQTDTFFSQLTVAETLTVAANLQSTTPPPPTLLNTLGLTTSLHRRVGRQTGAAGGLSGGEKRRLSVAIETIGSKSVILADEPTTGLDSSQAGMVVKLIKDLAKARGVAAVMTLHAPRHSVYKMLDHVMLLGPRGVTVYTGPTAQVEAYFAKLGYKCEERNVAEFLIDLVSVDTEDEEQRVKDVERIEELVAAFKLGPQQQQDNPTASCVPSTSTPRVPFLKRWRTLLCRSVRQNVRETTVNLLRLSATFVLSGVFSAMFAESLEGAPCAKSVADRTALLSYATINMAMLSVMKTLDMFGREKPVVVRERMRDQYSGWEYLSAKAVAELPFDAGFSIVFAGLLKRSTNLSLSFAQLATVLGGVTVASDMLGFCVGSVCDTPESALSLGVPVMVVYMVVGIINPSGVSDGGKGGSGGLARLIGVARAASPIRWAIEALCCAEFRGMKLKKGGWFDRARMGALASVGSGDDVLTALGLGAKGWTDGVKKLGGLALVEGIVAAVALGVSTGPARRKM